MCERAGVREGANASDCGPYVRCPDQDGNRGERVEDMMTIKIVTLARFDSLETKMSVYADANSLFLTWHSTRSPPISLTHSTTLTPHPHTISLELTSSTPPPTSMRTAIVANGSLCTSSTSGLVKISCMLVDMFLTSLHVSSGEAAITHMLMCA